MAAEEMGDGRQQDQRKEKEGFEQVTWVTISLWMGGQGRTTSNPHTQHIYTQP